MPKPVCLIQAMSLVKCDIHNPANHFWRFSFEIEAHTQAEVIDRLNELCPGLTIKADPKVPSILAQRLMGRVKK